MHIPDGSINANRPYCGRFAPSPTGPLHLGSLTTALASYLEARQHDGKWLLRIEDIDPPREVAGSSEDIRYTLESHGFCWDGPVIYQKDRMTAYEEALNRLLSMGDAYPCSCTRSELATDLEGHPYYPGTCRNGINAKHRPLSIRLRTHHHPIGFNDVVQGRYEQCLESTTGDFVIRRSDGWFAYQLAVVVDDAAQGVTDVIRGWDLMDSTPRQLYLYECLALPPPRYGHLPILVDPEGRKLGKSLKSVALDPSNPVENLWRALMLLGQAPPLDLRHISVFGLWEWAQAHWSLEVLRGTRTIKVYDKI